MPTISQLPSSDQVTAADKIPVSQAGATRAVTVGTLLASTQPAVISASGTLLGRISTGPGGPEIDRSRSGPACSMMARLPPRDADHATYPVQTDLTPTDQVVLNSAGNPKLLTLSLLRGLFSAGANITISSSGTIAADVVAGSASGPRRQLQHHQPTARHKHGRERPRRDQSGWRGPYDQLCQPAGRPDDRPGAACRRRCRHRCAMGRPGQQYHAAADLCGGVVVADRQTSPYRLPVVESPKTRAWMRRYTTAGFWCAASRSRSRPCC